MNVTPQGILLLVTFLLEQVGENGIRLCGREAG